MDGVLRGCRLQLLVLLILSAAPIRAAAEDFVCSPITRGDTATRLARRLMGNAAAAYSDRFQIRDPTRRMFVPKSQYQRLKPHWEVCVIPPPRPIDPLVEPDAAPIAEDPASTADAPISGPVALAMSSMAAVPDDVDSPIARVFGPAAGAALLLLLVVAAIVSPRLTPHPIPASIKQAGDAFIAAFARPLIDPTSSTPPIETRLRFVRRRNHLEIAIAPGRGRRYPNLTDHKKNVEYDIERVLRVIDHRVELGATPRARGKWVIVPVRLKDVTHTGAL